MKKYKYLFAGLCSMFMLTGCLDNFQELNTNPESLGSVDPRSAFTGATQNLNNCSRSHLTAKYSGTMVYMQYLVSSGGPSDGYYITPSKTTRTEPGIYTYSFYYSTNGDGYGGFGLRLN